MLFCPETKQAGKLGTEENSMDTINNVTVFDIFYQCHCTLQPMSGNKIAAQQ